jgi:hypothetical protein
MAVTPFQSTILRLLASAHKRRDESYVAGGVALNALLKAPRVSRDIGLFHDSEQALAATWDADRRTLVTDGFEVRVVREASGFVEAVVQRQGQRSSMQWARDSAYRFFPLVEDPLMGLALHPFDLATNKVLAMAGRLEVRDWVDVLSCDRRLQPFGYLIWAACGKDPGYNPRSLLASAQRQRYSQPEVDTLDFEGDPPDAAALGRHWHDTLDAASRLIDLLPAEHVGTCVLMRRDELCTLDSAALGGALARGEISYHAGRIGGSWPRVTA